MIFIFLFYIINYITTIENRIDNANSAQIDDMRDKEKLSTPLL